MYAFCCNQRSLLCEGLAVNLRNSRSVLYNGFPLNSRNLLISEPGDVQNVRFSLIKFFSSKKKSISLTEEDKQQQKRSFAVSYLMDSCGLSPEDALAVCKRVKFESSKGPDSVLALLREHGFENPHISRLVSRFPRLLTFNAEKNLMPKLKFLCSIGLSDSELPKVICSCPNLINCSLENRVVPAYNFLKSTVGDDTKITVLLSRAWWVSGIDVQRDIVPNVTLLKEIGTPHSIIMSLVSSYTAILSQKREHFGAKVKEVINMGFDPTKMGFVHALAAIIQMTKSTRHKKVEVFKKWGWSDAEISLAFRKNPMCFRLSESKIENGMDFLVNNMGFQSTAIARNPAVLSYSLEKRIIPRCLVVKFLKLKGLRNNDLSMHTYLCLSEELFLVSYVTKYQEKIPEILDVYQGEVDLEELGIGTDYINKKSCL